MYHGILLRLLFCLPLFLISYEGNPLKNPGFEKFANGEPAGWKSNNIPGVLTVVSLSEKAFSGKSSTKCEVKDFYGTKIPGMMRQDDIEVSGDELQMRGYYLLRSIGGDAGFISIDVKTAGASTIASCDHVLAEVRNGFNQFSFSGVLPSGARKIDVVLTLIQSKSGRSLHEGSYILFDGLDLPYTVPGQKQFHKSLLSRRRDTTNCFN